MFANGQAPILIAYNFKFDLMFEVFLCSLNIDRMANDMKLTQNGESLNNTKTNVFM